MRTADLGPLDRRVRIERPIADAAFDGAGSDTWAEVGFAWATVVDALPSRAEKLDAGINMASRPARVRMRWRGDLTAAMRLVLLRWDAGAKVYDDERVMQIVAGPAEIGRRDGIEVMAEEWTSAGSAA